MKFHSGEIAVQERAGVRDAAEDVGEMIRDRVAPGTKEFLALRRVAVLGTVDVDGSAWASVVTGEFGFIATPDEQTITIRLPSPFHDPLVDNLAVEGHIALFVPDFVAPRRIRLNGHGTIKEGRIWLTTDEVYGNCKRYIQERLLTGVRPTPRAESHRTYARRGINSGATGPDRAGRHVVHRNRPSGARGGCLAQRRQARLRPGNRLRVTSPFRITMATACSTRSAISR